MNKKVLLLLFLAAIWANETKSQIAMSGIKVNSEQLSRATYASDIQLQEKMIKGRVTDQEFPAQ